MTATARVVVTAPASGHGKTAVSIGLLAALRARGVTVAGFKIGPDFVDAAYLGLAGGRPGRNLDPRLTGPGLLGPLFRHGSSGTSVAVIEGTQGMFDIASAHQDARSTAQVAADLGAPLILVVDVAQTGQSVAALVRGFRDHQPGSRLGGVILNRVLSGHHEHVLRQAIDQVGVPVLGVLPRRAVSTATALLPGRRHGLVPVVHGGLDAIRAVHRLGAAVAEFVDLNAVVALARSARDFGGTTWSPPQSWSPVPSGDSRPSAPDSRPSAPESGRPVIAVAGGAVFGYGYPEAAELLTAAGAQVVTFDPLRDSHLPPGAAGLVVGGGLPEEYLDQLAGNTDLARDVIRLVAEGGPVVAEGAGLAWLCRRYEGAQMCGVIDAVARDTDMLVTGYRVATAPTGSALMAPGELAVGHKCHRFVVEPRSGRGRPPTGAAWEWAGRPEGFAQRALHASALSLHWAAVPAVAARLVRLAAAAGRQPRRDPAAVTVVLPAGGAGSAGSPTVRLPASRGESGAGDSAALTTVLAANGSPAAAGSGSGPALSAGSPAVAGSGSGPATPSGDRAGVEGDSPATSPGSATAAGSATAGGSVTSAGSATAGGSATSAGSVTAAGPATGDGSTDADGSGPDGRTGAADRPSGPDRAASPVDTEVRAPVAE